MLPTASRGDRQYFYKIDRRIFQILTLVSICFHIFVQEASPKVRKRTFKRETTFYMKDWKNTTASNIQEVQEDTTETSRWTGGFPSLNLSSLSPLSAPLGE